MNFVNPQAEHDLSCGIPLRLNLGSGGGRRSGFYGVDLLPLHGVDIVADLNEPLSALPDDSVEEIYTRHTLEHIANFLGLVTEIGRVVRPNGRIEIIVPHFSNPYGYSDPTHVRFFGLYSMYYFVNPADQPEMRKVPPYYSSSRFRVESVTIEFGREVGKCGRLVASVLNRIVNRKFRWQDFYERHLSSMFRAYEIRYVLRSAKERKPCASLGGVGRWARRFGYSPDTCGCSSIGLSGADRGGGVAGCP